MESILTQAVRSVQKSAFHKTLIMGLALQAITDHFGSQFISFVNTNILVTDLAEEHELTYPYSLDMPWVERSFVMDAIDDLRPKALRDGGRIVYMAFFGCTSWNAEKRRLFNKIASRRAHDSNPEH